MSKNDKNQYETVADEIDRDRETRVVDVTAEGVTVENIFTGARATVTNAEDALRFSHREGAKWAQQDKQP